MKVSNICGKCGEQNIITSKEIVRETVYDDKGNKLFLTCYYCSNCRQLRVLQIDDDETQATLQLIRELVCKVMGDEHKSKKKVKIYMSRRKDLQNKLFRLRKKLNMKYVGEHVKNERFDIYNLTINNRGDIIC